MEILTGILRIRSALSALFFVVLASANAAEGDSLEYAVKAAYLYKFGMYVDWPNGTFASPASPINVCIAGEDPFGTVLDTAANGQRVDGHPVLVKRLKTLTRDAGCHIVYSASPDAQRYFETVHGSNVLTVGEGRGVAIIHFVIKDNRVRFSIDEDAAAQNGLAISSKLLSLAMQVKPRQSK